MLLANTFRKKQVDTSSIDDGVTLTKAWKKLMFVPVSDLWNLTGIHHCAATMSVLGTEGFAFDYTIACHMPLLSDFNKLRLEEISDFPEFSETSFTR